MLGVRAFIVAASSREATVAARTGRSVHRLRAREVVVDLASDEGAGYEVRR